MKNVTHEVLDQCQWAIGDLFQKERLGTLQHY